MESVILGDVKVSESTKLLTILIALIVTFLWSSSYVFIRLGLKNYIPPLFFAGFRYLIGSIILFAVWIIRDIQSIGNYKQRLVHIKKSQLLALVVMGISGFMLEPALRYLGMDPNYGALHAAYSSLISCFNPVIVAFMLFIVYKKKIHNKQIIGLFIALLGSLIFFLLRPDMQGITDSEFLGIILTLGSGVAWGIYQITNSATSSLRDPLTQTLIAMTTGAVCLLLVSFTLENSYLFLLSDTAVLQEAFFLIIILGIFNTSLAYFLWNAVIDKVGTFEITALQNTMTIQVALFAFLFLSEPIWPNMIFGMIMVSIGVFLTQFYSNKQNTQNSFD